MKGCLGNICTCVPNNRGLLLGWQKAPQRHHHTWACNSIIMVHRLCRQACSAMSVVEWIHGRWQLAPFICLSKQQLSEFYAVVCWVKGFDYNSSPPVNSSTAITPPLHHRQASGYATKIHEPDFKVDSHRTDM